MFGLTPRLRLSSPLSSSLAAIDEGAGACERMKKRPGRISFVRVVPLDLDILVDFDASFFLSRDYD